MRTNVCMPWTHTFTQQEAFSYSWLRECFQTFKSETFIKLLGTLWAQTTLLQTKTFGKIEPVNKAFLQLATAYFFFFFRDKTFLFFKIESWNFQVQFEIEFCETSQNFNSIRKPIKKMKISIVKSWWYTSMTWVVG